MHLSRFLLCFVAAVSGVSASRHTSTQPILFAGTYTCDMGWINGKGKGIYTYKIMDDGSLTKWAITEVGTNPTYVIASHKKFSTGNKVIYAVNSIDEMVPEEPGKVTGYVLALTLNADGTLKLLNAVYTLGGSPTHISLNQNETFMVVSNYAGSFTMFSINQEDGSLGKTTYHKEFLKGSMVVKKRQDTGHIHSSLWLPNSDHLVVANLGDDELLQYKLKSKKQTLKRMKTLKSSPGAGPRQIALHPEGKIAYVVNELSNTVTVYEVDTEAAKLSKKALQEITTLPNDFGNSTSTSADIHLSSNGKFLYTSNRGHDSIAIFKIETNGTLVSLGWEKSRGKSPRSFVVYHNHLIVANQDTNDMFVFNVNSKTGLLSFTGNKYTIHSAVGLHVANF
ncbi:unnamed protein product [Peronospora destructor]|uniref:6-phosphogluconolactonase n=1 Tax=Peronospora destructor TaxID=86335 RepID=A0AAV0U6U1_9STRA|nr:unnamed protein product [Peronospora destructor]